MGLYLVTGRLSSGNLHIIVGNFLADDKSDAGWADGRGSRSQGRPVKTWKLWIGGLHRSLASDCIMLHVHLVPVCRQCMELWTMMRKLCGSPAPAGVAATSSPTREQVPIISHAADPELGMVTLVPAVLCSHCNQHLSPIDICVTVVLLVSSSCNLLPICFNHIILY